MDIKDAVFALGDWTEGRGPLYQRLGAAFRGAIARGDLGPPTRLPSERDLARALQVSRTTVLMAYRLLRDEGLVESARGSGTRVVASQATGVSTPSVVTPSLRFLGDAGGDVVDCAAASISEVDGVPDELLSVSADELRSVAGEFVYEPLGLPALRASIACRYLSLGLPTDPDQILITTGAQQAVQLLFALFGQDRGTLLVENPTYVGALDAARSVGATVVGAETRDGVADLGDVSDKLRRLPVRAVYVMTSCQNPTGAVMDDDQRTRLAAIAGSTGVPIIDDMTLSDLAFGDRPRPMLAGLGEGNVISVGSLSKLFWPGLRIGWVRADRLLIARLARLKVVADLGSSHISQLLAARLVPIIETFAAERRAQLVHRLEIFTNLMEEQLPSWSFRPPQGGPFVWVRLPGSDGDDFARVALRHGVQVLPGARMSPDGSTSDHLRVSYVSDPEVLALAIGRLREAWDSFGPSRRLGRVDVVV